MQDELTGLLKSAKASIEQATDISAVEQLRIKYLGKKGALTDLLKQVSSLSAEDRPILGKVVNQVKEELQHSLKAREEKLQILALEKQIVAETIDISLPGRNAQIGNLHPVTLVRNRVSQLFTGMGFQVVEGPEIEDEYHNFDALNIFSHHPARAAQDTFYFENGFLLRTHTSPTQIRVMHSQQPPLRIITPGRVYRPDYDQTHTPMFHQVEGLVIDRNCTFADLKGLLEAFLKQFFESDLELRFRPGYFPFTEPSAEVDIRTGQGNWLEVLGCGMVHPEVLRKGFIDPEQYSGFAFGLGLDRLAMLRYNISDLRLLFANDLRFLQQF